MKKKHPLFSIWALWILTFACFFAHPANSQMPDPVTWEISASESTEEAGLYTITFTAHIEDGWKVYSQDMEEGGPIPTTLNFKKPLNGIDLRGQALENGRVKIYQEPVFECMIVKGYEHSLVISQQVKVDITDINIKGFLDYQTCSSTRCLPPISLFFIWKPGETPYRVEEPEDMDWENLTENYKTAEKPTVTGKIHVEKDGPCGAVDEDEILDPELEDPDDLPGGDYDRNSDGGSGHLILGPYEFLQHEDTSPVYT